MRTQHANRYYTSEPVPDEVFYDAIEVARFGPQGGNRQPVRFIVVRDAEKRRQLGEWYIVPWKKYFNAAQEGAKAMAAEDGGEKAVWTGWSNPQKSMHDADTFAEHYGEHPTIIVVCAALGDTHPTDLALDRHSISLGLLDLPDRPEPLPGAARQGRRNRGHASS